MQGLELISLRQMPFSSKYDSIISSVDQYSGFSMLKLDFKRTKAFLFNQ